MMMMMMHVHSVSVKFIILFVCWSWRRSLLRV